eukprot:5369806-Prorocentrum_lima.AAC.1
MTSSLVGSEMCIRDSPLGGEPTRLPSIMAQPADQNAICKATGHCQCESCLLYTSDAADDM